MSVWTDSLDNFVMGSSVSSISNIPQLLHIHACIVWGLESGPVSGRSSRDIDLSLTLLQQV
jgi:hypothetical protein